MEEYNKKLTHRFCRDVRRQHLQCSQDELAERLGVDIRTIQNAENGPHMPGGYVLTGYQKLAPLALLQRFLEALLLPKVILRTPGPTAHMLETISS